jgi:hypothetical protein
MSGPGRHLGTPALAPEGMRPVDIPKYYARVIAIDYSAKNILNGNKVIWPLCPLPHGMMIEWTPEMANMKCI